MNRFLTIVQLIPAIIGLVKEVETLIPGRGQGTTKLNLVLNTVQTAAEGAPEVLSAISKEDLQATTTAIVNTTVATLNSAGVFKK